VWYRALDRLERGILSLAAQVVDRVDSELLGVELVKIVKKLSDAMRSGFAKCIEEFGVPRARIITSQAAVVFGDVRAFEWISDFGFVRYLAFSKLNAPSGWVT